MSHRSCERTQRPTQQKFNLIYLKMDWEKWTYNVIILGNWHTTMPSDEWTHLAD